MKAAKITFLWVMFLVMACLYFVVAFPISIVCGTLMGMAEAISNATQYFYELKNAHPGGKEGV